MRNGIFGLLDVVAGVEALDVLGNLFDATVPDTIEHFRVKGGPTETQREQAAKFIGKVLALAPAALVTRMREDIVRDDTSALAVAMIFSIAVRAFEPKGITIYGRTFRAHAEAAP